MERIDPRSNPRSLDEVPALLAKGAHAYTESRFWDAHEAWEEAWHAFRGAGREADASFVQGLILAAAAFENLKRGKPSGFLRQMAQGLHQLRGAPEAGGALGLADPRAFVESLTSLYLDCARRTRFEAWSDLPGAPPDLRFTSSP